MIAVTVPDCDRLLSGNDTGFMRYMCLDLYAALTVYRHDSARLKTNFKLCFKAFYEM